MPDTSSTPTPRKTPPTNVLQLFPDGAGLYVEPGQVAWVLAQRFQPYADGTVESAALPFAVLRMPSHFARQLCVDTLKQLDTVEAAVKEQVRAAQQASEQKKLSLVPTTTDTKTAANES